MHYALTALSHNSRTWVLYTDSCQLESQGTGTQTLYAGREAKLCQVVSTIKYSYHVDVIDEEGPISECRQLQGDTWSICQR